MAKKQQDEGKQATPSMKNVDIEQPLKGMNTDISPQAQLDGTYRFALNAVNNTEEGQQGYLSTEEGTFECMDLGHNPYVHIITYNQNTDLPLIDPATGFPFFTSVQLTGTWKVIGHVYVGDDQIIAFLTGEFVDNLTGNSYSLSRLIEFNIDSCNTKILLTSDCLSFDINHQIQGVHRIRKGCERNIYFTDNHNEPRQINLDSLDSYLNTGVSPSSVFDDTPNISFESTTNIWDCKQFRLFTLVEVPHIQYIRTDDSGGFNMKPGTYQICIRYLDEDLNPSRFFDITNPIPIYDDDAQPNNVLFSDIEGTHSYTLDDDGTVATGRLTTKSIVYNFSRLDVSYSFIEVVVVPSTTGTGMNDGVAYSVDTIPIVGQGSIDYRFRGIDPEVAKEITLEEVLVPNIGYAKAKTIAQSENRLLLGNLTSSAIDHALFQRAALNITSRYITKTVDANSKTDTPKGGNYYFDGRSYMRDEVYSFAIVWVFKDGSETPAYHIPGRAKDRDSGYNIIGPTDINSPVDNGYNINLGAQHNRELSANAFDPNTTTNWDGASYAPDLHNMNHITADGAFNNQPTYERWRVYNTAIRDTVSWDNNGDVFYTEGELAYWESGDNRYPDLRDCEGNPIYQITHTDGTVEDLTNQPIRHHKMPDTTLEPHFYGAQNADNQAYPNNTNLQSNASNQFLTQEKLSILGVNFANINPPSGFASDGEAWVDKLQGYKIVKQERTEFDKTVLDKGILYYNYQARTYSKGGEYGGDPREMCMGDGNPDTDQGCWFWFQGNSYNKHIGLFWADDTLTLSFTSMQDDLNPFSTSSWLSTFNQHFEPSLYVPSGCASVGAFNSGAGNCVNGTMCGWCESPYTGCMPYSNIEWGGTGWNGGQHSGWASWAGWPFHNNNVLTIGDCDPNGNTTPGLSCADLTGCTIFAPGGTQNPGNDIRHQLSGSYTNNLSYHGPLTKFENSDPVPTHIKVERILQGDLTNKYCKQNRHMTGCNPTQWITGQQPDGSFIASVCKYDYSTVPYYNISQAINDGNSAFAANGTDRLFLGHFDWPFHSFPLSNRRILNSAGARCQERIDGRIADPFVRSIDNCKQGDAFVIELDGGTDWFVGNSFNPLGWGLAFPGSNGTQYAFNFTQINNDNSNISKCSDADDSTGEGNNQNPPSDANINMLDNDIWSSCHYVSLKVNNPAQYGPILSAVYIPSSNNLTYLDDANAASGWVTSNGIDTSVSTDFNGDSFISRLAFRKHGHFKKCGGSGFGPIAPPLSLPVASYFTEQVNYLVSRQTPYFWTETSINTDLRHGGFQQEESWYPYNFEGNLTLPILERWYDKEGLFQIGAPSNGVVETMGWDGIDNSGGYGDPGEYPVMCEQYNYNKDYSKNNNENKYFGLPLGFDYCSDCYENFPHRIVYSVQSFQEETADNFRVFTSESYTDIPGHRGDITNIFTLNNVLYGHTEESLWTLFTSQETLQTTEGTEVSLGTGEFLSKPPREIIEARTGYGGSVSQWATLNTSQGTFFVDATDGKIFMLGQKLENISALGMSNWFEENIPMKMYEQVPEFINRDNPANPLGIGYIIALDRNNQRVIVTKKDYRLVTQRDEGLVYNSEGEFIDPMTNTVIDDFDNYPQHFENCSWTVSYSLLTKAWTSFHSYTPNVYISGKDSFVSVINKDNLLEGKHDLNGPKNNYLNYYGNIEKFIVDTISTTNPLSVETYENYHFHTKSRRFVSERNQWVDEKDVTFDQVVLYNDYQGTRTLNFRQRESNQPAPGLPYNMQGSISNNPNEVLLDMKERVWGFNGFRDMITDRTQPMFTSRWVLGAYVNQYFIDKIINGAAFTGSRPWNERQKFRDKYLGIRLIFSNLAGDTTIPKITFNYLHSGMTNSSR